MKELHQVQGTQNEAYTSAKAAMFSDDMFKEGTSGNAKWKSLANSRLKQLSETLEGISA